MLMALFALLACEMVPPDVERRDIDEALLMGRMKTACKGLEMSGDEIREYAAEKLAAKMVDTTDPMDPDDRQTAQDCVCAAAIDDRNGLYDAAVLKGLGGTELDELVSCVLPALDDPRNAEYFEEIVVGLAATRAPITTTRLKALAMDGGAPAEPRVRAVTYFTGRGEEEVVDFLLGLLAGDKAKEVRAAAADALAGHKEERVIRALKVAAADDGEGTVRARALMALRKSRVPEADEMVCRAMMEDDSPAVRRQAVMAFKGTKRDAAMDCLQKRTMEKEEDPGVREAILKVLGSSPNKRAGKVLCDAIPFWVRSYVKKLHPDRDRGTDIITAQNNRDWENSYSCVARAVAQGGYTCKGQQYAAAWLRELGGQAYVPKCPGDKGGAEGAEMSMDGARVGG